MNDTSIVTGKYKCVKCNSNHFEITFAVDTINVEVMLIWAECLECAHEECLNDTEHKKKFAQIQENDA